MKVKEIEVNGKIYHANYVDNVSDINICDSCDLRLECMANDDQEISHVCSINDFINHFKEVKQNTSNKFYKFSSGSVFNIKYVKTIINIAFVEPWSENQDIFSFNVLLKDDIVISFRFKTKAIANKERNKFIKFIENYNN